MPLTNKIQEFCSIPESQRDYSSGALLLLQVTGNKVQYNMFKRAGFAPFAGVINKRLAEILEFRLQKITHTQVITMKKKSDAIERASRDNEEFIRAGKRPDHDSLPDEIQAAYKEALDILRKQRELHAEIRRIALRKCSSCKDSDMFPFVKEVIALDTRRLALWKSYDSFST